MAKKEFTEDDNESSLLEIINKAENIKESTIKAIDKVKIEPTKNNVVLAIDSIKSDELLEDDLRDSLVKQLKTDYIKLFNPDNCPDDYKSLKDEAKFLAGMTQYSFLLMAQRLVKIRDKALYKEGGYPDFKSFINGELSVSKRTVYDYIDFVTYFGVQAPALDESEIHYSKLTAFLPLLKSKNPLIPKEELKEKFLNESKIKSFRELREEAINLKIKYGLSEQKNKTNVPKMIENFLANIPDKLEDYDKVKMSHFIEKLKKYV